MTVTIFTSLISKGGILMMPLLLCSVLTVAAILERAMFWASVGRNRNRKAVQEILKQMQDGDFDSAKALAANSTDDIAEIFYDGLKYLDTTQAAFDRAVSQKMAKMRKSLALLDTIIAVAPLLGILGTVLGIIQSFDLLGQAGLQDPSAVTSGIAQALITTAAGLSVAITAMIPYNIFIRKLEKAADTYTDYLSQFEVAYKKGKRAA